MATLVDTGITSLDGYVADEDGSFEWSVPDEEVHSFVNDLERPVGTYLYERRMYEVMAAWETISLAGQPPFILPDDARCELELLDERRFGNGVVHLHYRTRT